MSDTNTSSRNALWVPLLAGMAGAAAALLLAPRSGRETRQQLREAAMGAKDKAADGLETAKASVEELHKQASLAKSRVAEVIKTKRQRTGQSGHVDDQTNTQDTDRQRADWDEEV